MAVLCSYIRTACCCSHDHIRQSIGCCTALKYLAQRVPSLCDSIAWRTFHSLFFFSSGGTKMNLMELKEGGGGDKVGNIISHLYKYVILFIVSCSCRTISIWRCKQMVNTTWVTCIIIYTNVWIYYCLFTDVKRYH
jgi:hypothetical protein